MLDLVPPFHPQITKKKWSNKEGKKCPSPPPWLEGNSQRFDKFYFVPPRAGDHREPRTPPWRGAVRLRAPYKPPTSGPPTYHGLNGRVLQYVYEDIPTGSGRGLLSSLGGLLSGYVS